MYTSRRQSAHGYACAVVCHRVSSPVCVIANIRLSTLATACVLSLWLELSYIGPSSHPKALMHRASSPRPAIGLSSIVHACPLGLSFLHVATARRHVHVRVIGKVCSLELSLHSACSASRLELASYSTALSTPHGRQLLDSRQTWFECVASKANVADWPSRDDCSFVVDNFASEFVPTVLPQVDSWGPVEEALATAAAVDLSRPSLRARGRKRPAAQGREV